MSFNKLTDFTVYKAARTLPELLLALEQQQFATVDFFNLNGQIDSWSYVRLLKKAKVVAAYLLEQGLQKGDTVSIVLPTSPEFLQVFFGVQLAGGVPCALYPPVRLGKLDEWKAKTAYMIKAINSFVVITEKRMFNLLGEPVATAEPKKGCWKIEDIQCEIEFSPSEYSQDDLCFIQFSSGTTGNPKPVAITHANALSNTCAILASFPLKREEMSCVSWLPLYHDMGLVGTLMSSMTVPSTITLIPPEVFVARPNSWLKALTLSQASISVGPNFAYGLLTNKVSEDELKAYDLSHWKIAMCGAEPVQAQTMRKFLHKFKACGFAETALSPVYGMAEATLAVTFTDIGQGMKSQKFSLPSLLAEGVAKISEDEGIEMVTVGRPLNETFIEIRQEERVLSENRLGEIFVKGPGVMRGYFQREDETQQVLQAGWLKTGDLGFLHQGELYIFGRIKDVLIIRGRNYDPSMVEACLHEIKELRSGCYVAFSSRFQDEDTEELVVMAEVKNLRKLSLEKTVEIKQAAILKIQEETQLLAKEVVLVEEGIIPRTSSGKLQRSLAKGQWESQSLKKNPRFLLLSVLRHQLKGWLKHLRR